MHLLGTSVVAFILLPLVFSCKHTKPKEQISLDYQYVIKRQLEHIKTNIEKQLNKLCGNKGTRLPMANATDIFSAACRRIPKGLETELETEVWNFLGTIKASLGCKCKIHQGEQTPTNQTTKKLCKLKHILARIQQAYEQFNSAP